MTINYDEVHRLAKLAADAGKTLDESCPWPFGTREGIRFREVFFMHKAALLALGLHDKPLTPD